MAMYDLLLCLSLAVCVADAGKLIITHKPDYLRVDEKATTIKVSDVQHLLSAVNGFTSHKEFNFNGVFTPPPFQHPAATFLLAVYGVDDINAAGDKFSTDADDVYVPLHSLEHRLKNFYGSDNNQFKLELDTKVSDLDYPLDRLSENPADVSKAIKKYLGETSLLDSSKEAVSKCLRKIALILQLLDLVSQDDTGSADLFYFELEIDEMLDEAERQELTTLIQSLLQRVKSAAVKRYGENCLVAVVSQTTGKPGLIRKTRSLLAEHTDPVAAPLSGLDQDEKTFNVATDWSPDYPVIFHIILWLMVFMTLITIYVMHGMMTMDPGSDSIIYRMTTTRLKKEN